MLCFGLCGRTGRISKILNVSKSTCLKCLSGLEFNCLNFEAIKTIRDESPRRRISPAAGFRLTASEWELACTFSVLFRRRFVEKVFLVLRGRIMCFLERNLVYVTRIIRKMSRNQRNIESKNYKSRPCRRNRKIRANRCAIPSWRDPKRLL